MAECEWVSCHVLMVFPLRNVHESSSHSGRVNSQRRTAPAAHIPMFQELRTVILTTANTNIEDRIG